MSDDPHYDWSAFVHPVKNDDEPEFTHEELEQHNYRREDWEKPYLVPKFKDQYVWSFDHTLAAFIDMGLTAMMGIGHIYAEDDIKRARDAFRAYATKDEAPFDPNKGFPFEDINTPEYAETMWALDWLKEHFTALWT